MAEAAYADLETPGQVLNEDDERYPPAQNNAWAGALARGNVTRCVTQNRRLGHKAPRMLAICCVDT